MSKRVPASLNSELILELQPLPFSDSFLFEPVNTIGSESDLEQLSGSILSEKNPSESSTWLLDSFGEDVENLNMDFTRDTPCLFS